MSMPRTVEYSTNYSWAAGTGTFTAVTDFLADGFEPGVEEPQTTEMGDGTTEQDGVILRGEFKATGANVPAAGTRTWFRFTDQSGAIRVVGGTDGCRVVVSETSLRPVGGGPVYSLVQYTAAGDAAGDTVKTPA